LLQARDKNLKVNSKDNKSEALVLRINLRNTKIRIAHSYILLSSLEPKEVENNPIVLHTHITQNEKMEDPLFSCFCRVVFTKDYNALF